MNLTPLVSAESGTIFREKSREDVTHKKHWYEQIVEAASEFLGLKRFKKPLVLSI